MTHSVEQHPKTGEILSPAELGKRTHAAITDIAAKLQGVPEFGAALHQAFFGETHIKANMHPLLLSSYQSPHEPVLTIAEKAARAKQIQEEMCRSRISFQKGRHDWQILFYTEAGTHHTPVNLTSRAIVTRLEIIKDTSNRWSDVISLTTASTESRGKVSGFNDGTADMKIDGQDYRGTAALEKLPEFLGGLFTPIKL